MAAIKTIRTTAFRLSAEHFGTVHVYRPGPHFTRAWTRLNDHWKERGDHQGERYLPYAGLAVGLRCLSGDFVALERRVDRERAVVLSRQPISPEQLEMAFAAWESSALGLDDMPVSSLVGDLAHEQVEVASLVRKRQGHPPTLEGGNWPWDVAIWEVAHRLASSPMRTDIGPVGLRVDSDAALLTWDHVVSPDGKEAAAMHKIVPLLVTIPGVESPVVSFQSSLVRLAPSWRESKGSKFAWASLDDGAPILRARVRHKRQNGGFVCEWSDRAAEVLKGASLKPLPQANAEPSLRGGMRSGYGRQPKWHDIGKGVGTWFHECVAHHARACLGESASPVTLEASRSSWPSKTAVASRPSLAFGRDETEVEVRFLVVYANSRTRRRVRDAIAQVLREEANADDLEAINGFCERLHSLGDGETLRQGPVEVRFVSPPDAKRWLLQRAAPEDTVAWLDTWLPDQRDGDSLVAALVETDESASSGDDDLSDPKHVLRGAFGERGGVTQFITAASEPDEKKRRKAEEKGKFYDHPAANAVSDLMRSGNFFLRPFPAYGVEPGTLMVGIYGARVTKGKSGKRKTTYLVNLVAVAAGERDAWGYVPNRGWKPLDEATAAFLGSDQDHDAGAARRLVETAVEQLRLAFRRRKAVLLFDALGCRRFWSCLQDKSDGKPEPWMVSGKRAVVRVRTTASELVRPAGAHDWGDDLAPAKHTNFRPMRISDAEGHGPTVVLSGSAVMDNVRGARSSTRFGATDRDLGDEWHSLGATEVLVLEPGSWSREQLAEQVAMLCRVAPTWDRVLRWPSPLHLARAVVQDHPHQFFADGDIEVEEVEDSKQIRFDF